MGKKAVSDFRIAVFGDGEFELGLIGRDYRAGESLPALLCLVHRLLGEPKNVAYRSLLFRQVLEAHRGLDWYKKAKRAIWQAQREGYHAAVIVVDRDREATQKKNVPLRKARDEMFAAGFPPCATGVAVEAFDAWMIVDGRAVQEAGGDGTNCHGSPEGLDGKEGSGRHPKDWAGKLLGGHAGLGAKYAIIASKVDLELLRECCPKGFAPFAAEVCGRLAPLLAE